MRTPTLLTITLVTTLIAGPALAQSVIPAEERVPVDERVDAPPPRVIDITPEDTVRVERYVREEVDVPVIEEHMTLRPGSVIPEGVALRVFSRDSALARFAYFMSVDNKIVIADPRTRVVVRIIDKKS